MSGYRFTPAARRDLSSIWDFTRHHWDVDQAEAYIVEIREAVERIAADPGRGRLCGDIRVSYRRYAVASHLIFYVERNGWMEVVRILHQRMDPTRHL